MLQRIINFYNLRKMVDTTQRNDIETVNYEGKTHYGNTVQQQHQILLSNPNARTRSENKPTNTPNDGAVVAELAD